jgi:hypothetical protein
VLHLDLDDDAPEGEAVWGVFCERDLEAEYPHGHFIDNYATEEEAVEAWNGRSE